MTSWQPYWFPKTMKRQPCWCPKPILWELNSFLMQTPPFVPIKLHKCWQREWKYCIECFHSRGQHLCKCFGTKEIICIRKEFISHRTGLGHQHGHRFIVLGHQYGRRDVMWKHSIAYSHTFKISKRCFYFFWRKYGRVIKYMYVVSLTRSRTNSYSNCIILSTLSWKGLKR